MVLNAILTVNDVEPYSFGFYIMAFALFWCGCTLVGLLYDMAACLLHKGSNNNEWQDTKDKMFAVTFLPVINTIYCALIIVHVVMLVFTPSTYKNVFGWFKQIFKRQK